MKLKDIIGSMASKFAALVLTFGLVGGVWGATSVGTWSALRTAANSGGEIVLTDDIVADDNWGSIELDEGQSVELDLAGHSISVPADWFPSGLISIYEGTSFTIKGSGIIDASSVEAGDFTAIYNGGSLTIKSGVTIMVNANAGLNAYALDCEYGDTTIVEDGVVLDGAVSPAGFNRAADGKTVVGKHTVSGGNIVFESSASEPGSVVAKIGDTEYTSLAAAISDVLANGTETTIVMQADAVLDAMVTIAAGKNVKLDLNGRSITTATQSNGNHYYAFDNRGTLKIVDSSNEKTGSITARGLFNQAGGVLTLEECKVTAQDDNGGACVWTYGGSTTTIIGGEYYSVAGNACVINAQGNLYITGGSFIMDPAGTKYVYAVKATGSQTEIVNATVRGTHGAVSIEGGAATINGGTYVCTGISGITDNCLYVMGNASLTVRDGTFRGDADTPAGGAALCVDGDSPNASALILGGSFSNTSGGDVWGNANTSIKGGTFANLIETSRVAIGYKLQDNGDGTKTVVPAGAALIGNTVYATFAEAIEAAGENDEIIVIDDTAAVPAGWEIADGKLVRDPYAYLGTKVADGFYQKANTYEASTDFYITSKAGLEYFRDLVNQVGTVADTYVSTFVQPATATTAAGWYTTSIFGGKTVHLMTDVDLNNEEWSPIGEPKNTAGDRRYFYGNFNGENHTIRNLKATQYTEAIKTWNPGLFGYIGSQTGQTFSNLTIENVTLVGYDYAGAVVGNAGSNATAFNNCHVTGAIDIKCMMMTDAFVGGIVGIGTSAIDDCSVKGTAGSTIQGSTVGGLAGTSTRTAIETANTVTDSTVTGVTVKSNDNGGQAGGLVGKATNPVTVTGNTVHDVTVSAEAGKADVLVGGVGGNVTASSNTTDTNVTVISDPYAAYVKVADGFYQNAATYAASTDFYITNLNGLKYFRDIVNGVADVCAEYVSKGFSGYATALQLFQNNIFQDRTVHLLSDLDLSGEQWVTIGYQDVDSKGLKNLIFYGTFDAGIYDGNGNLTGTHKISNLDVAESYAADGSSLKRTYTGLFGRLAGGTATGVKNLTIENARVSGRDYVGAIAGRIYQAGAVIENCHVIGAVSINGTSAWVGGLVGECRGSIVDSSVDATGTISGRYDVGGLAGGLYQYGYTTTVSMTGSSANNVTVSAGLAYGLGGLVGVAGLAGANYTANVTISDNTANNVTVTTSDTNYAGDGLVGVLVGYANENSAYAIVADNTVAGTTSATENGTAITTQIGADNATSAIVGTGVTFDESGKVTGGIFESLPASAIASGYVTADNPNTETNVSYPLTIGGPYVAVIYDSDTGKFKQGFKTLADALSGAADGETITLISGPDEAISAKGEVTGNKTIYITGTAKFNWEAGWLMVGRGSNPGDGTLIFTNATIYASQHMYPGSTGFNISGHEKGSATKNDGTIIVVDSYIECNYLSNKGVLKVVGNGTVAQTPNLSIYGGFDVAGRPASETASGEDATASVELSNGAYLQIVHMNGLGVGREGKGVVLVTQGSKLEHTTDEAYINIANKGTLYLDATSQFVGHKMNRGGTIEIDATGVVSGTKIFDLSDTSSLEGDVTVNNLVAPMMAIYDADGDVTLMSVAAIVNDSSDALVGRYETLAEAVEAYQNGYTIVVVDKTQTIPEGWMFKESGNVTTLVKAVAQIGANKYETLAEAIAAANDDETVKMLADTEIESGISVAKDITLDLNGKTVSYTSTSSSATYVFTVLDGEMTVVDTAENGAIAATGSGRAFYLSGGSLSVEGGAISAPSWTIINYGTGDIAVSGGSVSTTSGNGAIENISTGNVIISGEALISASAHQAIRNDNAGKVTVMEGTVSAGGKNGIYNAGTGAVEISGGRISAVSLRGVYNAGNGTVDISGGEISASEAAVWNAASKENTGVVNITGGTLTANNKAVYSAGGTVNISGGTLVATYDTIYNEDGYVKVGGTAVLRSTMDPSRSIYSGGTAGNNGSLDRFEINGGSIDGVIEFSSTTGTYSITGGIFSDSPTKGVAEGYSVVDNLDTATKEAYPYTILSDNEAQIVREGVVQQKGTLAAMIAAATSGDTIQLLADVSLTERLFVNAGAEPAYAGSNNRYATTSEDKAITLDLNGKNITSASNIALAGGSLNITGTGTISTTGPGLAPIEVRGTGDLANKRTLTIGEDVTLDSTSRSYGLNVFGSNDAQKNIIDVTVNGTVNGTLFVLGNLTNAENEINIVVNGTVIAPNGTGTDVNVGIALNGNANVTVNDGATVSGDSGIEVRAGNLTVNGGTISATSQEYGYKPNGSGSTTKGAAIAVAQHGTLLPTTATLNGGTLSGTKQIAVTDVNGNMDAVTVKATQGYTQSSAIPDDYKWVETGTAGEYTLAPKSYVAQIVRDDEVVGKYETLQAAVDAAKDGDTVQLLTDINATSTVVINKALTLDGDYTITSGEAAAIDVVGTGAVTIKCNVMATNGHGINVGDSAHYSGKLTVDGSTVTVAKRGINVFDVDSGFGLNVMDSTIQSNVADPTTTYTTGEDSRGINFSSDPLEYSVAITDSTIQGFSYDINVYSDSQNISLTMTGGATYGRAALNIWGSNNTLTLDGVEVHGLNNQTGPTEAFACIVENKGATNNAYNINGCTFNAELSSAAASASGSTASEQLLLMNGTGSTVNIKGNTTYAATVGGEPATAANADRFGFILNNDGVEKNTITLDATSLANLKDDIDDVIDTTTNVDGQGNVTLSYVVPAYRFYVANSKLNYAIGEFAELFAGCANMYALQLRTNVEIADTLNWTKTGDDQRVLFINQDAYGLTAANNAKINLAAGDVVLSDKTLDILTAPEGYVVNSYVDDQNQWYKFGDNGSGGISVSVVSYPYVYEVALPVAQIGTTKYTTLPDAIAAAQNGETIQLLADVSLTERLFVNAGAEPVYAANNRYATTSENKAITLDMNGKDITSASNIALAGGSLNITGTGTISTTGSGLAPIEVRGTGDLANKRTLTIGAGVTLSGDYGLNVFGSNDAQKNIIDVTVNGTVNGTLFVLGNLTNAENEINIVVNGTVIAPNGTGTDVNVGIALNGNANVTVNNGATVSGDSGIEVRAGTLTVNGGTISATSQEYSYKPNGSGSTTKGAAIVVAQHVTRLPTTAMLNGGTLSGTKQIAVTDVNGNMDAVTVKATQGYTQSSAIPDDYKWVETGTAEEYTLVPKSYVAQIVETGAKFETLQAAINAVPSGNANAMTIKLLSDISLDCSSPSDTCSVNVNKNNVVIDGQELYKITPSESADWNKYKVGGEKQGFGQYNLIKVTGSNVVLKNTTIDIGELRGVSCATTVGGSNVTYQNMHYLGRGSGHYYGYADGGTLTFKDCVIEVQGYGVHCSNEKHAFDLVIDGCTIYGWNSVGAATSMTVTDSHFYGADDTGKNGLLAKVRAYCPATIINSTFSTDFVYTPGKTANYYGVDVSADVVLKLNGCSVVNTDGTPASYDVWQVVHGEEGKSPYPNAVLAIDSTGDAENGYTGGTFVTVTGTINCAEGYKAERIGCDDGLYVAYQVVPVPLEVIAAADGKVTLSKSVEEAGYTFQRQVGEGAWEAVSEMKVVSSADELPESGKSQTYKFQFAKSGEAPIPVGSTVGILHVANNQTSETTIIGVPWFALGEKITVDSLVYLGNRSAGDTITAYNATNGKYYSWTLAKGEGDALVWTKDSTFKEGEESNTDDTPEASAFELQRGQGLFLTRTDKTKPIYLVGRADGTAAATTTLAKGTADKPTWSLLAAPSTTALNLNSSAFKSDTYDKDTIMLPTTGAGVKMAYTYKDDKWGTLTTYEKTINGEKAYFTKRDTEHATVPAGTGFWFLNKSAEKDVKWTSGGTN